MNIAEEISQKSFIALIVLILLVILLGAVLALVLKDKIDIRDRVDPTIGDNNDSNDPKP